MRPATNLHKMHKTQHTHTHTHKTKIADLRLSGPIIYIQWESGQQHKGCTVSQDWKSAHKVTAENIKQYLQSPRCGVAVYYAEQFSVYHPANRTN